MTTTRDDFSPATKLALAKRSGFHCAICNALTIGPSAESPLSVTNVGVAAHICAAAPGGRRYDKTMRTEQRMGIKNGIWLCQTHAKAIDSDEVTWTIERLIETKLAHEKHIHRLLGVPERKDIQVSHRSARDVNGITPREYAFIHIGALIPEYREFLRPMIVDRRLNDDTELGILMSGDPVGSGGEASWTTFVDAQWLRWLLASQESDFGFHGEMPTKFIHGRVPGRPDEFFEFLAGIVMANAVFVWQRCPDGFLVLCQPKNSLGRPEKRRPRG